MLVRRYFSASQHANPRGWRSGVRGVASNVLNSKYMINKHPHQSFLDEFQIAIDKLVPLTPGEHVEEAKSLHKELSDNHETSQKQIHQALSVVGRKEYPFRKAYHEICAGDEEQRLQKAAFEHMEPAVRKKVEGVTKHGVLLDDLVRSKMFEESFGGDERYQIEKAILLADEVVDTQCDDRAHKRKQQFDDLVNNWHSEAERLQGMISSLRRMGEESPEWQAEIHTTCDRLEEGWSVVERDPTEEEIIKEIEYWNTVLHEGEDE